MFGLNDNTNNRYGDTTQMSPSDASAANASLSLDSAPPAPVSSTPSASSTPPATGMPPSSNSSQPIDSASIKAPPAGINDVSLDNAYIDNGPAAPKADASTNAPKPSAASLVNGGNDDELLKLKQQALQSLAPLVDHLEQNPE
jgi:hypothetical protein